MGRLRAATDLVVDAWTALSFKDPLRENAKTRDFMQPTWLRPEDARRLNAYLILAAYEANAGRAFLSTDDEDERAEHREYGDAAVIVDAIMSALLGESQEIVVVGADDYDPALEDAERTEGTTDDDGNAVPATGPTEDELAANDDARTLQELQTFLRDWAEDVHLPLRLADAERQAVHLGDAVYLLGWDGERERPTMSVMDPGCYFPVLPDTIDTYAYPTRVHFAWELPAEDFPDNKPRLRRLTYSLERIRWDFDEATGEPVQPDDTTVDADGYTLLRVYPWSEDKPSRYACYFTDATWILNGDTQRDKIDGLTADAASYEFNDDGVMLRDHDLGIDFLPVVHVPNTPHGGHHFGQSSLARVLQVLDDLQAVDTDLQRASSTTGNPTVVIHGATAPAAGNPRDVRAMDAERRGTTTGADVDRFDIGGGGALFVGQAGGATVLDTAGQLAALGKAVKDLRSRLHENSRLPAALVGTMNPSEAPSGYAIQLSFGPLDSMIRQMRLTRAVKHPLILKMVVRLYQANEGLEPGPTPKMLLQLGSYLPSDQAGTLELVKSALEAGLISVETALQMLVEVGFPIDDIAEEIERIAHRDFEGANQLADLGLLQQALEYLGRQPETAPTPTVPQPDAPTPPTLT